MEDCTSVFRKQSNIWNETFSKVFEVLPIFAKSASVTIRQDSEYISGITLQGHYIFK